MPGATSVQAFPYPFINEAATPVSVQNLANQVDTKLGTVDASRATALRRDTARVKNTGCNAVVVGSITTASYNTEEWDIGGMANLALNNDRLTIQKTGLYYLFGSIYGDFIDVATTVELSLARNGTQIVRHKERAEIVNIADRHVGVSCIRALTAADFVQLIIFWSGTLGPENFCEATLGARLIAV